MIVLSPPNQRDVARIDSPCAQNQYVPGNQQTDIAIIVLRDHVYDESRHEEKPTPWQCEGDAPSLVFTTHSVSLILGLQMEVSVRPSSIDGRT